MGDWKNFGEWARAVRSADAAGEPDPRLGPPMPEPAPLTAGEVAQIAAFAAALPPAGVPGYISIGDDTGGYLIPADAPEMVRLAREAERQRAEGGG